MLPKNHRITPPQFRKNSSRYSHIENPFLQIIAKPNGLGIVRVGIVVPKRLDKRSVYRNRTKRKISEVIHKKVIGESVGVDCMIKAKKIFSDDQNDIFTKSTEIIFQKAVLTDGGINPNTGR